MLKFNLLALAFLLVLVSCDNTTTSTNTGQTTDTTTTEQTTSTTETTEVSPIKLADQLAQEVEDNIGNYNPTELEDATVQDINVCSITAYTHSTKTQSKIEYSCFDGDRTLREATLYYLDGQPVVANFNWEKYNAPPSNPSAYDETKTSQVQRKIYFKEGQLNDFLKVVDNDGTSAPLNENRQADWEIIVAAINQ